MGSYERLHYKWNSIPYYQSSYIRVDANHPLDWYIGYETNNLKALLLVSDIEPVFIHSSKSIDVSKGLREDSKWTLSFRLIQSEQEDVFIRLCSDLIESSRNHVNDLQGIEFISHRYSQWAALMERHRNGLLSDNEKKGLIGELLYLQEVISNGTPALEAVDGWMGPEGADQDFIYTFGWKEVKTLNHGANFVTISSLDQLNASSNGELLIFLIDKTSFNDKDAFTLNDKVKKIQNILCDNYSALDLFNAKLLKYGYIDLPEYDHESFKFYSIKRYQINDSFPRLIPSNVPFPVVSAKYQLSIKALEPWRII